MITSIARQSVILKCIRQKSVMVSNYEFYYLAGLLNRCFGLECQETMEPSELFSYIEGKLDGLTPQNDQETYLIKLVKYYEPLEDYNDQMKELFRWGEGEQNLWQVNI